MTRSNKIKKQTSFCTWICLYFLCRTPITNLSSVHAVISRMSLGKLSFSITRLWYLPAMNGLCNIKQICQSYKNISLRCDQCKKCINSALSLGGYSILLHGFPTWHMQTHIKMEGLYGVKPGYIKIPIDAVYIKQIMGNPYMESMRLKI